MRMGSYLILNVILFIGCYTIVMCSPDALVSDLEQDPAEVHQSDGVIAFIQDPDEQVPDELDRSMDAVKAYVKAMHKATRKGNQDFQQSMVGREMAQLTNQPSHGNLVISDAVRYDTDEWFPKHSHQRLSLKVRMKKCTQQHRGRIHQKQNKMGQR